MSEQPDTDLQRRVDEARKAFQRRGGFLGSQPEQEKAAEERAREQERVRPERTGGA